MLCKTRGILLKTIKYSESSIIARIFTETHGLQSFMINGVRSGKSAVRASHLQILTLGELDIYYKEGQDLHRIKEFKANPALNHLHYEMEKSSIAVFMAEVMNNSIVDNAIDENLFEFLSNTIQLLDVVDCPCPVFPHYFMLNLSRYLGFFPSSFELEEIFSLCGIENYSGPGYEDFSKIKMNNNQRRSLLDQLIKHFQTHIDQFRELRSRAILTEILSA